MISFVSNLVGFGAGNAHTRAGITVLTLPFDTSEIGWLNVTNAALGIVVVVLLALIGAAALRDLFPRVRFWLYGKRMDAEVRRLLTQYRL